MIALIEVAVFLLSFFSMDYSKIFDGYIPVFLKRFKFYCVEDHFSRWDTEVTPWAEILFTMHVIVIFMYSTINLMVLSTVPYKYNRFEKTDKEKEIEKEKRKKRKRKKQTDPN